VVVLTWPNRILGFGLGLFSVSWVGHEANSFDSLARPGHFNPNPTIPSLRTPLASQIWHKNSIQLYGFLIFNAAAFAYALFQYFQLLQVYEQSEFNDLLEVDYAEFRKYGIILIVLPTLIAVFECVYVWLTVKLVKEFGWKMYKRIGADPHMRCKERAPSEARARRESTDFCFFLRFLFFLGIASLVS
jgi:hypothetical protein